MKYSSASKPSFLTAMILSIFFSLLSLTQPTRADSSASLRPEQVLLLGVSDIAQEMLLAEESTLPTSSETTTPSGSVSALAKPVFDLIQYMRNNTDSRNESEVVVSLPRYNRLGMFGGWVNDNRTDNCYNTRIEVLIRDVSNPQTLVFGKSNPCILARGKWDDPYTGTEFTLASDIQADHFVPLKNAYLSGAHTWTDERRCHYTNYLGNGFHILAVSAHENMAKGGDTPEDYLPPNKAYVCQYLTQWLKTKAIWSLSYTANEKTAIEQSLAAHECSRGDTQVLNSEITAQRTASINVQDACLE